MALVESGGLWRILDGSGGLEGICRALETSKGSWSAMGYGGL